MGRAGTSCVSSAVKTHTWAETCRTKTNFSISTGKEEKHYVMGTVDTSREEKEVVNVPNTTPSHGQLKF